MLFVYIEKKEEKKKGKIIIGTYRERFDRLFKFKIRLYFTLQDIKKCHFVLIKHQKIIARFTLENDTCAI